MDRHGYLQVMPAELIQLHATLKGSSVAPFRGLILAFVVIWMSAVCTFSAPAASCERWRNAPTDENHLRSAASTVAQGSNMMSSPREYPPLIAAILSDDAQGVQKALAAGADPNERFQQVTPLGWALDGHRCAPEVIHALTEGGADLETPIWPTEQPPLHLALTGGKRACVQVLLEAGADALSREKAGATTIHAAALAGMIDMVDLFVERGVGISATTDRGWTALMAATLAGNEPIVRRLLELGADPCLRDSEGVTAADIARRRGLVSLEKELTVACSNRARKEPAQS